MLRRIVIFLELFYKDQSVVKNTVYFVSASDCTETVWICCEPRRGVFLLLLLFVRVFFAVSFVMNF